MSDKPNLNPHIASTPIYTPGISIEEVSAKYGVTDVLKLASNENPLGPSPRAMAAIQAALPGLFRYPRVADDQLRERLAERLGSPLGPEHIVTGNGGTELLAMISQGFIEAGDEAIICPPTFPMYEILTRRRGGHLVRVDLRSDYQYDVRAILQAITPQTRLIFVCSPNNPTGTIITRERADQLMAGVPDRVVVIFDQSYIDFVDREDHADALSYVRDGRYVISLRSFSKSHGLAGLRVGYAVTHPTLAEYLWRSRLPFHLSSLALVGAMAALDDTDHVGRIRELAITERAWLLERLKELGLFVIPSQSNFLVFRPGYDPCHVYECLVRRGVIVRPARLFYMPDFVRVSVGTHEENVRFIAMLKESLQELAAMGDVGEEAGEWTTPGEEVL